MATYHNSGSVSNQANIQNFHGPVSFGGSRDEPNQGKSTNSLLNTRQWPCQIIPLPKNEQFLGRLSQLERLEHLFLQGGRKVAIYGLGGIGKTQIALQFAYYIQDTYPECSVFWVPAISFENVQQVYLSIAKKLAIPEVGNSTNVMQQVKSFLSDSTNGQWVMIFDNADDIKLWYGDESTENGSTENIKLNDYLPHNSKSLTIFTSRSRKFALKLASRDPIDVQEMDMKTLEQVLQNGIIKKEILEDKKLVQQLITQLTLLPLAIVQACAYINENDINLSKYLELLNDHQEDNQIDLLSEDFKDEWRYAGIKNPTAITWIISFDRIRSTEPLAADYLSFMACLEPKAIPHSLLPPAPSRKKFTDAIGTLKAYSFVTKRIDASLDIHRLVHLATRNWLKRSQSLQHETEQVIKRMAEKFPSRNENHRIIWRSYMPHARHIITSDYFNDKEEANLELLDRVSFALWKDGMTKESAKLDEQTFRARQQILGPDHPSTLTSMNNLATTYQDQGQWDKAVDLQVQVLKMRQQILGPDHPSTLTSMSNLALTYQDQGQWDKAVDLQVQVLKMSQQILGPNHPDTLTSMNNLATTYHHQGQWDKAVDLQVQVLKMRQQILGPDHPSTLTSMSNLATTYQDQGQWDKAVDLQVQVLKMRQQILGPNHPDTLTSMNNLALTYQDQGQWDKAVDLQVQVLKMRQQILGSDHPETLTSMHNLAITWKSQNQSQQAIELMKQCVQFCLNKLGIDHPDTESSQEFLDGWLSEQRELDEQTGGSDVSGE